MAGTVEPIASSQTVVAITSTSGNAANVNNAVQLAQQAQLFDITLLGSIDANAPQQHNTTTTLNNNLDLLTLSPEALNLLNGVENASAASVGAQGQTVTDATFNQPLTLAQQDNLGSIVAQFSGQPLNQTTLLQMQQQLTLAGINPQQVSLQDMMLALDTTALPSATTVNVAANDELVETELLAA